MGVMMFRGGARSYNVLISVSEIVFVILQQFDTQSGHVWRRCHQTAFARSLLHLRMCACSRYKNSVNLCDILIKLE